VLVELLGKGQQWDRIIRTIHSTARWLRGRSAETFWDAQPDSCEWDYDDVRRADVKEYVPGQWDLSRYFLALEFRVQLGISWLHLNKADEAIVFYRHLN
jgi:hypothetical protein